MADNTIELPFEADTSKASKGVKKFADDSIKQIDKVSNAFKLVGVAAATALTFKVFKSAIDSAREADRAVQKLNVSLANTGEFSKESSAEIQAYAEELETLTGISDEAVLGAFSLAKSFGISNKQAQDLTTASIELAAATGVDLDTAVKQLGGTYSGTVGRLSKLSPEFGRLTKAQLENGAAIDLVNSKFRGTAEALSGDFEGSLNKAEIAFGNVFENLGKIITQNPAIITALSETAKVFTDISRSVSENQSSLSGFVTDIVNITAKATAIAAALGEAIFKAIDTAVKLIGFIPIAITEALGAFLKLAAFVGGGFTAAFQVVIGSIQKLVSLLAKVGALIPGFGDSFQKLSDDLAKTSAESFDKAFNFDATKTLVDQIGTAVNTINADISDGVNSISDGLESGRSTIEKFGVAATIVDQKTSNLKDTIVDTSKAFKNTGKEAKEAGDTLRNSFELAAEQFKGSIDKLRQSSADLKKSLEDRGKSAQELIDLERDRSLLLAENAEKEANALNKIGKLTNDQLGLVRQQISEFKDLADAKRESAKADLDAAQTREAFAQAGAITGQVFNGEEGARQFLSATSSKIADAFAPGAGAFVGPLITALSKGGDFAKAAITEFIEAIPVLIDNIVEALPVIVDTLVDVLINRGGIVKIAAALAKASVTSAPLIAQALIQSLAESAGLLVDSIMSYLGPRLGETFATIAQNLKNGFNDFFKPIIDPIQRLIDSLDKVAGAFGSGGGKGVVGETLDKVGLGAVTDGISKVGKVFGFAQGGVVPNAGSFVSMGTDTVPAMLTPGELVVPNDLVGQLASFLSGQSSSSGGGSDAMLAAIFQAVMSPMVVQSEVKVNENAFADIILQLNRQNARLA